MARKEEVVIIDDKIFSSIKKLELNDGDTLLFQIKTDDQGLPYIDLNEISKMFVGLDKVFPKNNIIFIFDKISLFSVEEQKETIERLKDYISLIQEQIRQAENIKNGEPENDFSFNNFNNETTNIRYEGV